MILFYIQDEPREIFSLNALENILLSFDIRERNSLNELFQGVEKYIYMKVWFIEHDFMNELKTLK